MLIVVPLLKAIAARSIAAIAKIPMAIAKEKLATTILSALRENRPDSVSSYRVCRSQLS